jgi:hypothetical protein
MILINVSRKPSQALATLGAKQETWHVDKQRLGL